MPSLTSSLLHLLKLTLVVVGVSGVINHGAQPYPSHAFSDPGRDLRRQAKEITINYYDIAGDDLKELKGAIRALGPADDTGARRDAYTRWEISWDWPVTSAVADYSKAKVDLDIEIVLPRWLPTETQIRDRELAKEWLRYIAVIVHHEGQHAQYAIEGAEELLQTIQTLPTDTSVQKADEAVRRAISRIRLRDYKYDRDTQHGIREGAALSVGGG